MNRIYKTIWNVATQSWTVAGELASAKGKSASKTVSTLAALSVASVLGVSSAMAEPTIATEAAGANNDNNIVTKQGRTVIIINNGGDVKTESDTTEKAKNIIVIGSQNRQVYDDQILIGYGFNSPGKDYSQNGKSAGKAGDVAIGNRITLGGSDSSGPKAQDSFSTAVGYASQAVGPVVAMGVGARSDMAAFGGWKSVKEGVVAVGPFALGANNQNSSTAVGALSAANHNYAVSLGALSGAANDWEDRGLGEQFEPSQSGKTQEEREAASMYKIREGAYATNREFAPTSVGYKAAARGYSSTAIGQQALTGSAHTKNGWNSTAVGVGAHAVKDNSLALGDQAIAGGLTADEIAKLDDEITRLGELKNLAVKRLGDAEVALQGNASAENKFKVASATAALERIKLAIERAEHDKKLKSENNSNTQFSIAVGSNAQATNYRATAIGRMSRAKGYSSNAIGNQALATGKNSNAIGSTTTDEGKDTVIKATKATGENSIAFGTGVGSNANNTIGIGSLSDVNGANSIAVGNSNQVSAENVTVVGNNIAVNNENGKTRNGAVVLGDSSDGSVTVKAVNSATVGKTTYSGFKGNLSGKDTDGKPVDAAGDKQGRFVSIGKSGEERQIKHVAAGEISENSTDAINGSQLYGMTSALDTRVTKNEGDIKNLDGRVTKNEGDIKNLDGRVTKNEGDITNINTKLGDINTNVKALGNRAWTISDGKNENSIKNDKVTFKGENGVTVSLGKDNTVTIKGGLTDADKQNIANDISNNIENVLNNKDVGFAIKQNGKNTLDANGNPLAKTEKVTPKDTINFVNGNGTTVKVVTKKGENKPGENKAADETTISVNVDAIKYTNKDGKDIIQEDGKYFVVDKDGNKTAIDEKDVVMNITNPKGGDTIINNLKDGEVSENSKEAVNGKQLHAVDKKVNENTKSINNLAGQVNENKQNISNLGDRINNINSTINNVVGDQVKNINNRVDGVENRVNQLDNKINNVDKRVNHLDNKISNVDKRASRGIATAGAMGMLPQPHISGRSMVSAATTSYRGQQSLAVGYSRLSDNGKHIIKFSGASNLSGKKDAMVGAAYGYQW